MRTEILGLTTQSANWQGNDNDGSKCTEYAADTLVSQLSISVSRSSSFFSSKKTNATTSFGPERGDKPSFSQNRREVGESCITDSPLLTASKGLSSGFKDTAELSPYGTRGHTINTCHRCGDVMKENSQPPNSICTLTTPSGGLLPTKWLIYLASACHT